MRETILQAVRYSALALAFCTPAVAGEFPSAPLGVDVTIDRRADGSYLSVVQVSDLATGEIVAAPKIAFGSGANAVVEVGASEPEGRPALKFEVSANESEWTALFRMTATRGGVETQLQQFRVRLR